MVYSPYMGPLWVDSSRYSVVRNDAFTDCLASELDPLAYVFFFHEQSMNYNTLTYNLSTFSLSS